MKTFETKFNFAPQKIANIEAEGQTFSFVQMEASTPSNTWVLHLPGFNADGEEYSGSMYKSMDGAYNAIALKTYQEPFAYNNLKKAIEDAIRLSGGGDIVLHGNSFGSMIVYGLISNPSDQEFLQRNNIKGAILETPVLDKDHLNVKLRNVDDKALLSRANLFIASGVSKLSDNYALGGGAVRFQKNELNKQMVAEVLRRKTENSLISTPTYVIFAEDDMLIDNQLIQATLNTQVKNLSTLTIASKGRHRHHAADYDAMWKAEKIMVEKFTSQ